jgi:hypothetical protein
VVQALLSLQFPQAGAAHAFMLALQTCVPVHFVMHLPPQFSCAAVQPQLPSEQVPPSGLVQLPGLAAQVPALQVSH